eukprot:TRINITY_DN9063_c0_g1_i1.p1 TRINITY_DN9063_c0_g1~~TRINITY_DN9063_c0_g1_i1.p1  ORF type:complete len:214 (+),score=94.52 TRINITY_DN9063_c0_g1_i1:67-708(+)
MPEEGSHDNPPEKRAAKAGRRANDGHEKDKHEKESKKEHKDHGESAVEKKGGWDTGPSTEQLEQQQREQEKKFEERYFGDDDPTAAVAANGLIPSLDSQTEREYIDQEDLTKKVAEAPKSYATQVQGLPDLERDGVALPTSGDDIDISILHEVMTANTARDDVDEEWVPTILFQQLRSELQAENEKDEKDPEEAKSPGAAAVGSGSPAFGWTK